LEDIAKQYNLTRERVRQIEAGALKKTRNSKMSAALKVYLAA